ncbi:MAG TPA: hypothetical protein VNQ79_25490 [Blastocatellia bacterium]|nr:hypothetical protein [Blastocatellia bacterium]
MGRQNSGKSGVRSTAEKMDSSRHGFNPQPAASPVAGASGKGRNRPAENFQGTDLLETRDKNVKTPAGRKALPQRSRNKQQ